jgi:hypothetical protein
MHLSHHQRPDRPAPGAGVKLAAYRKIFDLFM